MYEDCSTTGRAMQVHARSATHHASAPFSSPRELESLRVFLQTHVTQTGSRWAEPPMVTDVRTSVAGLMGTLGQRVEVVFREGRVRIKTQAVRDSLRPSYQVLKNCQSDPSHRPVILSRFLVSSTTW